MHYDIDQEGYKKCEDENTFIETLRNAANEYDFLLVSKNGNMLTFVNKDDGRTIFYFINTMVEESLKNSYIREKLNDSIWVHIEGFHPHDYGSKVGDLPNILEFYALIDELP